MLMELKQNAIDILAVLREHPEGLGVLQTQRDAGKIRGRKLIPKASFFPTFKSLKEQGLVEFVRKEKGKGGKDIYRITEKGKERLRGQRLFQLIRGLPFVDSAKEVEELFLRFQGSDEGIQIDKEGPKELPSFDVAWQWLYEDEAGIGTKVPMIWLFFKKHNSALQNIATNPKAKELMEDFTSQIWLKLLKDSGRRLTAVATKLKANGIMRRYASTSWLGSLMADHWLGALETIADCPPGQRAERLIVSAPSYNPKEDIISGIPIANEQFNNELRKFWEGFKVKAQKIPEFNF